MRRLLLLLMVPALLWASNFGMSTKGKNLIVSFEMTMSPDSVRLKLGLPSGSNYVNTLMTPKNSDSLAWEYQDADGLDSIGCHSLEVDWYDGGVLNKTFGIWLNSDSSVSATCELTGSGPYQDTLWVLNSADTTAIAQTWVAVFPLGGGTAAASWLANDNGRFIWNHSGGSFEIYSLKPGWRFDPTDTLILAGDNTDTLWGEDITPATAPPGMVTIYACLTDASGDTINPTYFRFRPVDDDSTKFDVLKRLTVGSGISSTAIAKDWRTVTSTSSCFEFFLYPNSVLSDTSSRYDFEASYKFSGQETRTIKAIVKVPAAGPFNPFAE